ncbi:dimethylsulfonioproprionate lyase family protein [Paracoccaceae bacterium Fryx2]|nr:dimethylsulfonioproprionate lyase family protein [Paracoccaceae bacterium Fryx2]
MTDDMTLAHLTTPPGVPGPGRLRYGAAMALHRQGKLSDAALEVYRICAPLDGEDPAALLAARGLGAEIRAACVPGPEAAVRALVAEADRYIATLPGPGVAEVRAGLGRFGGGAVRVLGRGNAVVDAHLGSALAPLALTHPALAAAIAAAVPHLDWATFDDYPAEDIGATFLAGNAYCIVVGEAGPIVAEGFDFGLFLVAPHVFYRDHHHKAPELYAPLTGPHGWRFRPGDALTVKPAHQPVWNEPDAPHATKVGAVPFLCLYGWTADVKAPARVIPSGDWPVLDALRMGRECWPI